MESSSPSRHLVEADLLPVLEPLHAVFCTLDENTLSKFRGFPDYPPAAEEEKNRVHFATHQVPGFRGAPDVQVLVYRTKEASGRVPCVVHVHGGGYVLSKAMSSDASNTALALKLHCSVVSVDYRLAPETPFPGALHDCYAALNWVMSSADQLEIDPTCVGVFGDSAGGGLAAAVTLMARDLQLDGAQEALSHPLRFQHLMYPMIDDRTCTREVSPFLGEFLWTPKQNAFGWRAYLGDLPAESVTKLAAPARASDDDLKGLPATFICTGSLDLFLEEDVDYALRLTLAGVPCELHVYPGAPHGFRLAREARVTQQYLRDSFAFLDRVMGAGRLGCCGVPGTSSC